MSRRCWVFGMLLVAFQACAIEMTEVADGVLERTAAFRTGQGLQRQKQQAQLAAAAQAFADYMARSSRYGHTADGRTPAERAAAQGYDYCLVLENIGYVYRSRGYPSADAIAADLVEGWKKSPEHRAAMLDAAATETGVGIARSDDGRYFGVQMFARPKREAIRFSINNASGASVDYRADDRAFALPARSTRTHAVCRPVRLEITLPGAARPYATEVGDRARYTVTPSGIRAD
jgi:Cysteine-rich secretory protein family